MLMPVVYSLTESRLTTLPSPCSEPHTQVRARRCNHHVTPLQSCTEECRATRHPHRQPAGDVGVGYSRAQMSVGRRGRQDGWLPRRTELLLVSCAIYVAHACLHTATAWTLRTSYRPWVQPTWHGAVGRGSGITVLCCRFCTLRLLTKCLVVVRESRRDAAAKPNKAIDMLFNAVCRFRRARSNG